MKRFLKALTALVTTTLIVVQAMPVVIAQDGYAAELPVVQNLAVESVDDGEVTLQWNAVTGATISGYIIQYGTVSISEGEGVYNRPPVNVGNVTKHTVDGLENGREYFFSIVARNEDTSQVSSGYSNEVSATPEGGSESDPEIIGVEAFDDTTVTVVFSKEIEFPANPATNVSIVKNFDNSSLGVELVTQTDPVTMTVKTATQDPGTEYILTISDLFKDTDGNPVVDIDRSQIFIGGEASDGSDIDETGEFKVSQIINVDQTAVEVIFSRNIVLGDNPDAEFAIVQSSNPEVELEVTEVRPNAEEQNKVLIMTERQENVEYTLLIGGVTDTNGAEMSDANKTVEFTGFQGTTSDDDTAPAKVADFNSQIIPTEEGAAKSQLKFTWTASTDPDLREYVISIKVDDGDYSILTTVPAGTNEFTATNLPDGAVYEFKIVAVDTGGNESEAATLIVDGGLLLANVGPGHLYALFALSLVTAYFYRRRSFAFNKA